MRRYKLKTGLLIYLVLFLSVQLHAQDGRFFTEFRANPILTDSMENFIFNSSGVSLFLINTIATENQRQIQGYTFKKKFALNVRNAKSMKQYILHPSTFIKSEYKVMLPFKPEVAVRYKRKKNFLTFLFSLKSSTVRIFYNGVLQEELLIDNNYGLMFIMKELLMD